MALITNGPFSFTNGPFRDPLVLQNGKAFLLELLRVDFAIIGGKFEHIRGRMGVIVRVIHALKSAGIARNAAGCSRWKNQLLTERKGISSSPSGILPVRQWSLMERTFSLEILPREDTMVPVMEPPPIFSSSAPTRGK
jgi:hypothetical protein